ncbi:ImmA/IrrE family metallo-endopeptidase [Pedobacter gandavensis]|uniref:ImmA/IrrE family metallo-endopeptidase n=1 Tax=Pedobacter gandavensis TaxID=2679963 RepID=UPI0024797A37|nr:ImmA/IrrE family metallo-endopeptidase [Pedobacter gandavensis]WGQ09022.1 ImmA/IrrE family metallo-endopeptidase [Pedobacter gandavensis]
MATNSILKRGFKAQAERLAVEYRGKLGLGPADPLCAFELAKYMGVQVFEATDFPKSEREISLLSGNGDQDCGWSALTMKTASGNTIIIHNSFHTAARQQSNIMHELAHIICEHSLKGLTHDVPLPIGMREYDKLQEEEAICLGATFQISKPGLMWAIEKNMSNTQIATYFNASEQMVSYRKRLSGAEKQAFYRKAYR